MPKDITEYLPKSPAITRSKLYELIVDCSRTIGSTDANTVLTELAKFFLEQVGSNTDYKCNYRLFAGCYTRSIEVPAGEIIIGHKTNVPTVLIAVGTCILRTGDTLQYLEGTNVIFEPAGIVRVAETITACTFVTCNATTAGNTEGATQEFEGG